MRRVGGGVAWIDAIPGWCWLLACAALAFAWWRAAGRAGRRSRARNLRARAAEDEAERLLAREGYALIERQAAAALLIEVDGEPREVGCRADLLVERDGRLYVADVKSGALATDPTLPATRRQLLEYLLAYEVDGALLVDMEARQIREVVFPALTPPR